jgi:membrane protein CcdC involved in cytochrome C biogenesis
MCRHANVTNNTVQLLVSFLSLSLVCYHVALLPLPERNETAKPGNVRKKAVLLRMLESAGQKIFLLPFQRVNNTESLESQVIHSKQLSVFTSSTDMSPVE